ncbi:MAG: class I SAM-dependent methyltransferase [Methanosarcinaceae archaeon]
MKNYIKIKKYKPIIFEWDTTKEELENQIKSCSTSEDIIITMKYLTNKNFKILEAGCGLGRVLKYVYDQGFKNINGIEISKKLSAFLQKEYPELRAIQGDILKMPYEKNYFDRILSYGVIEHFVESPLYPMKAMYKILKPGGIAIITIPSFNKVFQIQNFLSYFNPKLNNTIRKIFGKKSLHRNKKILSYHIYPQFGEFFEFRFTPKQFEQICLDTGFSIIESIPTLHMKSKSKLLNKLLLKIPFFHNHHHACVVQKPQTD